MLFTLELSKSKQTKQIIKNHIKNHQKSINEHRTAIHVKGFKKHDLPIVYFLIKAKRNKIIKCPVDNFSFWYRPFTLCNKLGLIFFDNYNPKGNTIQLHLSPLGKKYYNNYHKIHHFFLKMCTLLIPSFILWILVFSGFVHLVRKVSPTSLWENIGFWSIFIIILFFLSEFPLIIYSAYLSLTNVQNMDLLAFFKHNDSKNYNCYKNILHQDYKKSCIKHKHILYDYKEERRYN